MEAQAKLVFQRLLDLQDELMGLVERLCRETMMDPETRKKISDDAAALRERFRKTQRTISQ